MTYLITGGTGPNGSQVILELVKRGEKPVIYDVRPQTKLIEEILDKVKIVRGDVTDINQLMDVIKNENIDRIIHCAYYQSPEFKMYTLGTAEENPTIAFKINLLGTFNVFEAARILDVKKVVFISSWQVYTVPTIKPIPEDYPKTPEYRRTYAFGKLALESWGVEYSKAYGLDFIALRFSSLYGPGREETYMVSPDAYPMDYLLVNAARGKPVRGVKEGRKSQPIYTKDLAHAILLASSVEKPKSKIFNIGTDDILSMKDAADILRKIIPTADIEIIPAKEEGTPLMRAIDYTRAREELGYTPQYPIEKGMRDYINWVQSHP